MELDRYRPGAEVLSNQVMRLCSKHLDLDIVLIFLFVGGKFVLFPNTSKEPHKHLSSLLCVNKNTEFGVSFHIRKPLGYNYSSRGSKGSTLLLCLRYIGPNFKLKRLITGSFPRKKWSQVDTGLYIGGS